MSTAGVVDSDFGGVRGFAVMLDGLVEIRSSIEAIIMRIRILNFPQRIPLPVHHFKIR
jgi:hypothetical protein